MGPALWHSKLSHSLQHTIPYYSASWSPSCFTSDQLLADVTGKAAEDATCTWAPATYMAESAGTPGSRFQPGPALASAAIWGVNHQKKRTNSFSLFPPSLSPSLPVILPLKYMN